MSDKVSATPESLRAALVRLWVPTVGQAAGTPPQSLLRAEQKAQQPGPGGKTEGEYAGQVGGGQRPQRTPGSKYGGPAAALAGAKDRCPQPAAATASAAKQSAGAAAVRAMASTRASTAVCSRLPAQAQHKMQNAAPAQPRCKPLAGAARCKQAEGHGGPQAGPARGADVELVDAQPHQHGQRGGAQQAGRIRRLAPPTRVTSPVPTAERHPAGRAGQKAGLAQLAAHNAGGQRPMQAPASFQGGIQRLEQ